MPEAHFFIEQNGIAVQSSAQKFGPVDANEYRVTSTFDVSGTPIAYAICKGRVLIQAQTDAPGKVNLVLKPFEQLIEGIDIKYFIYRGLNEADFFTVINGEKNVLPGSTSASEFILKIRTEFTNFHSLDTAPEPLFLAKYLGYDPSVVGTELLDNLFFKESDWASTDANFHFELPMVEMGTALGTFGGADCGIDIIINNGDYITSESQENFGCDLDYVRAKYSSILLSQNVAKDKLKREQVHQFLDVAAFYGYFHTSDKGVGFGNLVNSQIKTGDAIYTDLLDKFQTKNRVYLHILSDRVRSYNYYNNYFLENSKTFSLKLGIEAGVNAPLNEISYETEGWPIIIDEALRNSVTPSNTIFFQLVHNRSNEVALTLVSGKYANKPENVFFDTALLKSESEDMLTAELSLNVPAIDSKNVAGFYFLRYYTSSLGSRIIDPQNENLNTRFFDFKDNLFFQIASQHSFKLTMASSDELILTDNRYFFGKKDEDKLALVSVARLETVIQSEATIMELSTFIAMSKFLSYTDRKTGVHQTKKYPSLISSQRKETNTIRELLSDYSLISFIDETDTILSIKSNALEEDTDDNLIHLLGITNTERQQLAQVIIDNELVNTSICFLPLHPGTETFVSIEGISYLKCRLALAGEVNGVLFIYSPTQDIIVYGLDNGIYTSKVYADHMFSQVLGVNAISYSEQ